MTKKIVCGLPEEIKSHICTLKKASKDTTNNLYMCESNITVIDFDKMPNEYSRGKGWNAVPSSNDALYVDEKKWYFIEFKNGGIKKNDIYKKAYDSVIMLLDWKIFSNIEFVRKNVEYILVYNKSKQELDSLALSHHYDYLERLSQEEEQLFDVDKLQGFLFLATHTYTKELFQKKFIALKEQEEGENAYTLQ